MNSTTRLNSTTPPPGRASLRIKPCNLLHTEASPEKKTKKQQEYADRAMKELSEQAALRDVHEKARMMIDTEEEERKKWEEVLAAQREIAEKEERKRARERKDTREEEKKGRLRKKQDS